MNSPISQPGDFCGSDMKVPTIYTNIQSNKSLEKNPFQLESKIKGVDNNSASRLIDVSGLDPHDSFQSESV